MNTNIQQKQELKSRVLLLAGVTGPAVYLLNVILGGAITPNYSHIRNAISELTQRGAPSIGLLSGLFVLSAIFFIAFGLSIIRQYRHINKRIVAGGVLTILYGVIAILLATIFPQDPIGTEATLAGSMHLVFAGLAALVIVVSILLIGFSMSRESKQWGHFKVYSILTVILMLLSGATTPVLMMNDIQLIGLFERLTQVFYLQWFATYAIKSYLAKLN